MFVLYKEIYSNHLRISTMFDKHTFVADPQCYFILYALFLHYMDVFVYCLEFHSQSDT